jgi:hypothetical protein
VLHATKELLNGAGPAAWYSATRGWAMRVQQCQAGMWALGDSKGLRGDHWHQPSPVTHPPSLLHTHL